MVDSSVVTLAQWEADSAAIGAVAADGLEVTIGFLGDWTGRDLIAHLGRVFAFAAANLNAAGTERSTPGTEAEPPDGDGIVDWYRDRRQALLDAFASSLPDGTVWTFTGPGTAAWWLRRMVHETAVHRWDLQTAIGPADAVAAIDPELATDGIDEYLEIGLRTSASRPDRVYPAETLHLHRSDGPGEWMLARGATEHEVVVTHEHGKGDAAVRGPAAELLLWIWGRPAADLEVFGDQAVAEAWQALAP